MDDVFLRQQQQLCHKLKSNDVIYIKLIRFTDAAWFGRPNCNVTDLFLFIIIKVFYKVNYFSFSKLAFLKSETYQKESRYLLRRLICVLKTSVFCFLLWLLLFYFNHPFFVFSLNKKLVDALIFMVQGLLILYKRFSIKISPKCDF